MPTFKVKTRDWGPAFQAVSDHIAAKSAATVNHSLQLQNEIATHQGHAYGRHGYQAGWVEQVIRGVTCITPDQTFSPTGVEAVIREWNIRWVGSDTGAFSQVVNTYNASGDPVHNVAKGSGFGGGNAPAGHTTSVGGSGGFLSPELQQRAWTKATVVAAPLINIAQAEYPGIAHPWKVVNRIMVVVEAAPSAGFGLGFKRTAAFTDRTRQQVLDLVEALETGKTRSQAGLPNTGAPTVGPHGVQLRAEGDRPAFTGVGDLLDYLGLEAFWQKTALVILEKDGATWKRVTMYPCELVGAGWAPANKIQGKPWSGRVKLTNNVIETKTVPAWRPA